METAAKVNFVIIYLILIITFIIFMIVAFYGYKHVINYDLIKDKLEKYKTNKILVLMGDGDIIYNKRFYETFTNGDYNLVNLLDVPIDRGTTTKIVTLNNDSIDNVILTSGAINNDVIYYDMANKDNNKISIKNSLYKFAYLPNNIEYIPLSLNSGVIIYTS